MKILKHIIVLTAIWINWIDCYANTNQISVHVNNLEFQIEKSIGDTNSIEQMVTKRIRKTIIDYETSKITVSNEVLSNCMLLYLSASGENPTKIVNAVSYKGTVIINALQKVILENKDKGLVYRNYLQNIMSSEEWETWLTTYNTKEKIDKLANLIPHSVTELERLSMVSLEKDVKEWLLLHKIMESASPSSKEVHSLYDNEYPKGIPPFAEVEETVKHKATDNVKNTALAQWWHMQIVKANISIQPEIPGVKALLNVPPTLPFLPPSIISYLEKIYSN